MNIKKWHIAGAFFTIVFGSLDHFFYHWSGEHPLVAAFSAVNESTWEHLKLLAAPVLLFSIFESIAYGRFRGGFLPAKVLSLILGMAAIILIFYGYTAAAGTHYLWADIATFFIAAALTWFLSYFLMKKENCAGIGVQLISRALLAAVLVSFLLFTVDPPHIFLFEDPVTGQYGL